MTSAGLLGVWGKWVKHAKYIYNIQDFNPEQVLAVGYTKSKFITDVILFASVWWELRRSDIVATMLHNLWIMPLIGLKVRGKKNGKV